MDCYTGHLARRSSQWVAVGPADELAAHAALHDIVEVTTESNNVARVRVDRVGAAFTRDGVILAYGYLEDATERVA